MEQNDKTMIAQKFYNDINILEDQIRLVYYKFGIELANTRYGDALIAEIIARLFEKTYGHFPDSNIYRFNRDYINAIPNEQGTSAENVSKRLRRETDIQYKAHQKFFSELKEMGLHAVSDITQKTRESKGTPRDLANMFMIDSMCLHELVEDYKGSSKQKDTLLDIVSKSDFSSKHITADSLHDAFLQVDNSYKRTKELSDKIDRISCPPERAQKQLEYIHRWINFYRMESSLSVTIIDKIANYMVEHHITDFDAEKDSDKYDAISWYWGTVQVNHSINLVYNENCDQYSFDLSDTLKINKPSVFQPISLLYYDKYIRNFFSEQPMSQSINDAMQKRLKSAYIVAIFEKFAYDIFKVFFENTDNCDIVDMVYKICRYRYPLIEAHSEYITYSYDPQKYSQKAKCLRKILSELFPPGEIQRYYKTSNKTTKR